MTRWQTGDAFSMGAKAAETHSTSNSAKSSLPVLGPTARIVIVSLGLLSALQFGGLIANALQADTPWLTTVCYTAPVFLAGGVFWLIGRLI